VLNKEGKKYLYRADMDKLDEMMEQRETQYTMPSM